MQVNNETLMQIVDSHVMQNGLIGHHVDSYNEFASKGISQIITQLFSVEFSMRNERDKTAEDRDIETIAYKANFTRAEIRPPTTDDFRTGVSEDLLPNHARKQRLNYSGQLLVDVEITATAYGKRTVQRTDNITAFPISNVPIMIGSKLCHTSNMSPAMRAAAEEDPNDAGGYFIIKGGEWVISSSETYIYNQPNIYRNIGYKNEIVRLELISRPGDAFENSSQIIIRLVSSGQIYINISHKFFNDVSIPFYVVFRLLGMITDQEICDNIAYGDAQMLETLRTAMTTPDRYFKRAHEIVSQNELLEHVISVSASMQQTDTETMRNYYKQNIISTFDERMLPHVGRTPESRHEKLRFLGHLIHKILLVEQQIVEPTDRDSLSIKRIYAAGMSMSRSFKQQFNLSVVQQIISSMRKNFKTMPFSQVQLSTSFRQAVDSQSLERALIQAIITGDKEIKLGKNRMKNRISSERLDRKNQMNMIAALRTVRAPVSTVSAQQDQRGKEMRQAHPSYLGFIDMIQSATTGPQVGMVKQMSLGCSLSLFNDSQLLAEVIARDPSLIPLGNVLPEQIANRTKVFVNGVWLGLVDNAPLFWYRWRDLRRGIAWQHWSDKPRAITPPCDQRTSIYWNSDAAEIHFWIDVGRPLRPLLVVRNNGELDPHGREIFPRVGTDTRSWEQGILLTPEHVQQLQRCEITVRELHARGIIDYISPEEQENTVIADDLRTLHKHRNDALHVYTHLELPVSLFGIPTLTCPHPEFSQAPKIVYQTNQSKQTNGIYALNWAHRFDKHAILQYYCEQPAIKTLSNKYIYPNGVNAVVAIAAYGGYNMEDSLFFNRASAQRGFTKCDHFGISYSELDKDEAFGTPVFEQTSDIKHHANYDKLQNGVPRVGTLLEHNDVIIGKYLELPNPDKYLYRDLSILYTGNEPARVCAVVRARNQDGTEFITVKYANTRELDVGSKFCVPETWQALTPHGWRALAELRIDDEIMTPAGWQACTMLAAWTCDSELYKFRNNNYELLCTAEHSIPTAVGMIAAQELYARVQLEDVAVYPVNVCSTLCAAHVMREYYRGVVMCPSVACGVFALRRNESSPEIWTGNSSRHGQKGMIGIGYRQSDMLFTESGIVPDLVLNPHALPSRMTIGQLIEGTTTQLALLRGLLGDATLHRDIDIEEIGNELESRGMSRHGIERMYNGQTGEWIDTLIYCTPCYYQRLQKFAIEEVYSINTGPTSLLTRQPLEGKANRGGLRIGEMEKDVLMSHGTSQFLMEKFRDNSDDFDIYVCRNCGERPVVNEERGIIRCTACEAQQQEPDLAKARCTWSSRLFMDELESMNVGVKFQLQEPRYE